MTRSAKEVVRLSIEGMWGKQRVELVDALVDRAYRAMDNSPDATS